MQHINVLDHGYVSYVAHMGNDNSPLEAARMSTGNPTGADAAKDDGLRSYLWRHGHVSPFEFCQLAVEMQAPIFVARQIFRHRTFSFNEFSGRYAEMPELFYVPDVSQVFAQDEANKQAGGAALSGRAAARIVDRISDCSNGSRYDYEQMIAQGLSREQARMVLPLNQYTRWRQSGNLRNWLHFLALRLDEHAQIETRKYARAVASIVADLWPKTFAIFEDHTLNGVRFSGREMDALHALLRAQPTGLEGKELQRFTVKLGIA